MKNYMNYAKEDINNAFMILDRMNPDDNIDLDKAIEELEFAKEYIEKAIKIGKEHLWFFRMIIMGKVLVGNEVDME